MIETDIFASDETADFREVVENALSRGLTIHPVRPRSKEPWLTAWNKQASKEKEVVQEWCRRFPNSNYGVAATEEYCILESDDALTFKNRLSKALPSTYTVQARDNRPHYYFRQTEASKNAGNMDCPGVFEFKQNNRYVVGEGSIHPSGPTYVCISDKPIAEIPSWLVEDLQRIRSGREVSVSAPMPAEGVKLGEGEGRHPLLMSQAARLWDGSKTREEFFADLEEVNQQHCGPPKSAAHLLDIIDWIMERAPVSAGPKVLVGSIWGTRADALVAREIPVRNALLVEESEKGKSEVVFYESSINQIVAWRGLGKTNFALGLAGCFAQGKGLLDFRATRECRVLYVDGELPLFQLRERVSSFCDSPNVFLVNPEDITPAESINILSDRHWAKVIQCVEAHKIDVLFLDSLSTVTRMRTNEEDDQIELQSKLNILRNRYHLCVITLHHTGKQGFQRGLSRNDDALDVQMMLQKVAGWEPGDGLKFEMTYEKIRHSAHLDKNYQVTLKDNAFVKGMSDTQQEIEDLLIQGKSLSGVAKELEIHRSKVQRVQRKLVAAGRITLNEKHNNRKEN